MHAVSRGLGIDGASSYAGVPDPYVRNWIARGRKQELEPFDAESITDKTIRATQEKFHLDVTMPCFRFWMRWKQTRSMFIIKCVERMSKSKDWRAHAWLLERVDPATFAAPGRTIGVRRDLLPNEKEVEATVIDEPDKENNGDVIQIILPDNKR